MARKTRLGRPQNAVRNADTIQPGSRRTSGQLSIKMLEDLVDDMKSGRIPLERMVVSDAIQPGLRVFVRKTGNISFHAHYEVQGSRPMLKIGEHPGTTLDKARKITKIVRDLANKGIDPQEGLHDRLLRELEKKGADWRP